jgi:uncharacterized protein YndB with AHSA1/START domain
MDNLSVERSIWIDAPRERVWLAMTDPDQIAKWFAPTSSFKQVGKRISVRFGDTEMEVAEIEVLDPPRRITTRNLMEPGLTTTYLLEEENGGTRVTVVEAGFEVLTPEARKARVEQNGKGWEGALQNLQAHLLGKPLPNPAGY